MKAFYKINKCLLCGETVAMPQKVCNSKENFLLKSWAENCRQSVRKALNLSDELRQSWTDAKYCEACTQLIRDIDFLVKTQERIQRDLRTKSLAVLRILENNWKQSARDNPTPRDGSYDAVLKTVYEDVSNGCSGLLQNRNKESEGVITEDDYDGRQRFSKSGRKLRYLYVQKQEDEEEPDQDDELIIGDLKESESEVSDMELSGVEAEAKIDDDDVEDKDVPSVGKKSKRLNNIEKQKTSMNCTVLGCKFRFYKKSALPAHIRKVHEGDKKPLHCDLCDKKYASRNAYFYHKKSHTGEVSKCTICSRIYYEPYELRKHQLKCTETTPYPKSGKRQLDAILAKCNYEGCEFEGYEIALMAHVRSTHLEAANHYACEVCKTEFSSESGYRLHMRKHEETPRFRCQFCNQDFWFPGELTKHIKRRHYAQDSQNLKFTCETCFKLFTTEADRITHEELHKTKPHPFTCVICETILTSFIDLKHHVNREHETGIPRCLACLKTFKNPKSLEKHVCGPRVIKLNCNMCAFIGQSTRELTQHKLDEHGSNFVCQVCGKLYLCKYSLRKHLRMHTGDLHLRCRLCPKAFNTHSKVKRHEQTHSKILSYFCVQCGKGFKSDKYLKQHHKYCREKRKSNTDASGSTPAAAATTSDQYQNEYLVEVDMDMFEPAGNAQTVRRSDQNNSMLLRH